MSKFRTKLLFGAAAIGASAALSLTMSLPASANVVPNARATNANVNPVAGYLAVGNDVNVNFDHVEAYLGAQDGIGDLQQSDTNGFGIGLCNSNITDTDGGPALQMGIVHLPDGNYQVEYGYGDMTPAAGAATDGDNCEDGALGNFAPGSATVSDGFGDVISPDFTFGNVEEVEIQYLHGEADFSFRQITSDNPGPWYSTGWISVTGEGGITTNCQFNEAEIGVDADTTGLVGPPSRTLAPFAHASVTSYTFASRHSSDQGWFDKAPNGEWTALQVDSYPNANTSDSADLAGADLNNGNGGVLEGSPVG
jgi:hypothetical protein